jgi:type IV pilus assembly protein PilY1
MSTGEKMISRKRAQTVFSVAAFVASTFSFGQVTDLSTAPLFTSQSSPVKPNLLYIIDDSGSMAWDYLPDEAGSLGGQNGGAYGEKSYQCNGLSYNPRVTYSPPVGASGGVFPSATFSAAWSDGIAANGVSMGTSATAGTATTVDLTGSTYYAYTGTQPAMSYTYNVGGVVKSTTFYAECNSQVGSAPGSSVFTPVVMTGASSDATNYANWYSYYRTRMLLTKTAVGQSFSSLGDNYRIGFANIHSKLPIIDVSDFTSAQKSQFYTDLYATKPGSSTPLRASFARAGQYFAKKAPSQTYDPIQYSCQHNFTLLSTDGYWNTGNETANGTATSNFGPFKLDNTTLVDQQDGTGTPRPYFDGWSIDKISTSVTTQVDTTVTTTVTPRTVTSTDTTSTTTTSYPYSKRQTVTTSMANTSTNPVSVVSLSKASGKVNVVITVTLPSHGFVVGDLFYLTTNVNPFASGTYTVVSVPDASTFTYTATGFSNSSPATATASGSSTVQKLAPGTCQSGKAYQTVQLQTVDVASAVTTSTTTSSVDTYLDTKVVTSYLTTTSTTTQITSNGVTGPATTSVTTANTPASTSTTTSTGPVNTTSTTGPTAGSPVLSNVGTWADLGAPTMPSVCANILSTPRITAVSGTFPPVSSTPTSTVTNPPASTGPTTAKLTAQATVSAVTTHGPLVGPVNSTQSVNSGGAVNSLSDVTMYYYSTDLRDSALGNCTGSLGRDVCANNVGASGSDTASTQHMTSFGLGLGAGGTLTYDPNYLNQKSGDYISIVQGTKNWPMPAADTATAIDDLWHAAVNGRGQYFSAKSPASLSSALSGTFAAIQSITGSASSAATSTLQPTQGDNDIFIGKFTSIKWTGDLQRYSIDPSTGSVSTTAAWSAQDQLEQMAPSNRKIYYSSPAAHGLAAFNSSNLAADGYTSYFQSFCTKTAASGTGNPTQCSTLSSTDLTAANTAGNLISYLRGDQTLSYYRGRDKMLGDIINASPVFVGKPKFTYTTGGYSAFASSKASRIGVVYAAANDGMLHAFKQSDGSELWAYVPTLMLPKLYKLADNGYSTSHDYFVDATPVMGDVYFNSAWHTIIVGGFGGGGQGYYALDITDPTNPVALWEFTDNDMGFTYGNPIITKRSDGTWVVAVTSGYNNTGGDGNGHLYLIDAQKGGNLLKLSTFTSGSTPAGTASAPSGLSKINAWVDSEINNTAKRFYGGDVLGNVWRFDVDSLVQPYKSAMLLGYLKSGNNRQPITTVPALAEVTSAKGVKYPVVYVATGKYLGSTDLASTAQQSVYAFKDKLLTTGYGDIRNPTAATTSSPASGNGLVAQFSNPSSVVNGKTITTSKGTPVDWDAKDGWLYDFTNAGERVNVNPNIVLNSLFVGTNIPSASACTVGGSSYEYQFDITSGMAPSSAANSALSVYMGATLIVGLTSIQLADNGANSGTVITITTKSDGVIEESGAAPNANSAVLKRTSWRELN